LVEGSDLFFELFDVGLVSVVLLLNQWSNLLLGVLGNLFQIIPVLVDLDKSLQLWVFRQLQKLEQLKGLIQLIDLESDIVGIVLNLLHILFHGKEDLYFTQFFVFGVDLLFGVSHGQLKFFTLFFDLGSHQTSVH
jgi:hypothetical protein